MAEDIVIIGVIGIDRKGDKHILGLVERATESAAAVQALLDNLIEPGSVQEVASSLRLTIADASICVYRHQSAKCDERTPRD